MHRIVIPLGLVSLLFACGAETTLEIVTPSADLITRNGTVNLQVSVDGDKPDRLELWRNGARWLELDEPYAYAWHTDSEPEGRYELVARAVRGDQHQESSIRVVQLDRTLPQVLSRTPATADDNVWRGAPVQMVFTEPLQRETVTEDAVSVSSWGAPVPKSVTLDETGTVLTLQLLQLPSLPAQVEVILGTGITDLAGNALPAAVAAWSWSYPVWQFPGGRGPAIENALASDLVFDAQGTPQLTFQEGSGAGTSSAWFDGHSWVQRSLIVGVQPGALAQPANGPLRMSVTHSAGVAPFHHQVWQLGADGWENPQVVNVLATRSAGPGRSALAASGEDLYAAFAESVPAQGANIYLQRQQGGVWTPVGGPLDRTLANSGSYPAIAIDEAGLPMVVFSEYTGSVYEIFATRWDGAAWVSMGGDLRTSATTRGDYPKIISTGGPPMVAFCEVSGSEADVRVGQWTGSFWNYTQVNGDPINNLGFCVELALVHSPASGPVVVYPSREDASTPQLHMSRFADGRWEPVGAPLNLKAGRSPKLPGARFDASGALWVTWSEENDGDSTDVVVARYNGTFGAN